MEAELESHATRRREGGFRGVTGIPRRCGFEEDHLSFFFSRRPMFDSVWNDEELAFIQLHNPIAELDPHLSAPDEEELIFHFVPVPRKDALEFHQLHFLAIQLADDFRPPMFGEGCKLFLEVDLFHCGKLKALKPGRKLRQSDGCNSGGAERAATIPPARTCADRFLLK